VIEKLNTYPVQQFKNSSDPNETIKEISEWVKSKVNTCNIIKVCISMFGPISISKGELYGTVLNTPKPGWKYFNVVNAFSNWLEIDSNKIILEIDVGCAAYLEHKQGNHK
jgi:fructokinase